MQQVKRSRALMSKTQLFNTRYKILQEPAEGLATIYNAEEYKEVKHTVRKNTARMARSGRVYLSLPQTALFDSNQGSVTSATDGYS